jgi:hypothetical protein
MTKEAGREMLDAVSAALPEELPLIGVVSVCGVIVTQYADSEEDAMHIVMELAVRIKNYYRSTSTEQCDCARCKAKRNELN